MRGPFQSSKRAFLLITLLAAALVALLFFWSDLQSAYRIASVQSAMRARDWRKAESILDGHPPSGRFAGQWYFLRGCVQRRGGDPGQAERAFEKAADLGWDSDAIARQRLLLQAQSPGMKEVEKELDQVVAKGAD